MTDWLKPTVDRKVWAYKGQRNTFGLLPGPEGTCPGATLGAGGCRTMTRPGRPDCYVYRIMQIYGGVRRILEHNTMLLKGAAQPVQEELLRNEFQRFVNDPRRPEGGCYRLHWAGDIFDRQYARALRRTMEEFSQVNFWTYTRSFDLVDEFRGQRNLLLYLSLDPCNRDLGLATHAREPWTRICWLEPTRPEGLKLLACPVDEGRLALEGACHKCRLCLRGHSIWFKTKR